jgi:hypothetical protein
MMIDRRAFIAATASLTLAPVLDLSAAQPSASEANVGRAVVLLIEGWSEPQQGDAADAVSIRVSHSWRTAWR